MSKPSKTNYVASHVCLMDQLVDSEEDVAWLRKSSIVTSRLGSDGSCQALQAFDAKEGLAPKIVFGFNAQASASRNLFDISPMLDQTKDRNSYEAASMVGT